MPPTTPESEHTTIHDQSKLRPISYRKSIKILSIIVLTLLTIALVGFITVAIIANPSTPDQKLYDFKTNIVEKVIKATKLSESSKLEYTTTLLEKRVAELLVLYSDQATSTPETIDRIASLTQQHVGDSVWLIDNSASLALEQKIMLLASITNTTRAFETLTDESAEFETIKDYSSDIQNIGQDSLKATVQTFASTSDQTAVSAFVGEQITVVGEEIKTVAENSRAQKLALTRINDAGEYITEAKFADAIYSLLRARQAIAVDRYLYAGERGEGVTEAPALDAIPEGS